MLIIRLSDGLIVYINKDFTKLLGYTFDECIKKQCHEINLYRNPEDYNKIINKLSEKDSCDSREVIFVKKDGTSSKGLIVSEIVNLNDVEYVFSTIHNDIENASVQEEVTIALELKAKNQELIFQNEEKEKRAAELLIANKELLFQTEEKADRAAELLIANKELLFQTEEKANRAAELLIANEELLYQTEEKADRAAELLIANKELLFQNEEKEKRAAELLIANKELVFQNDEKEKRADELLIANKELIFQNAEKAKRAAELLIANEELLYQTKEKASRAAELLIANEELLYQTQEKANRAAELLIANEELLYQTQEKANRAVELLIANKELVFQNNEKEKRADELLIVNKELVFQNDEILFLSYHDQLTGLYNRRFYEKQLKILDTSNNLPLTVVVGDVNGLKLINDSFGHAMGDRLLKKAAEVIKKCCGAHHIVSRTGGDEFVILMPETKSTEAELVIKLINETFIVEKLGSIEVSVSFGYKTKNNIKESIKEVVKNADKQMYSNKIFESPTMRGKIVDTIIKTLHEKNESLEQHSIRVSKLCVRMGTVLGLSTYKINELKTVGLLHDIGKIAIDENILNKPGKLTDSEWKEVKRHPEIGYRILETATGMSKVAEYVLSHHERWDGKGYPNSLQGNEIPFESRIIGIIDAYDAMISDRVYHTAKSEEEAVAELKRNAGLQFDPELVMLFTEEVLGKRE